MRGGKLLSKNIKKVLKQKVQSWIDSVNNDEIKDIIKNNTIITGGAIVSLLQDSKPNDFDVYFKDLNALQKITEYYVDKYIENSDIKPDSYAPKVEKCIWSKKDNRWVVLRDDEVSKHSDVRIRVFIKSNGAVGVDYNAHEDNDREFRKACANINQHIKTKEEDILENTFDPIFLSANAITLSDKIQLVLRFYGEPERIHKNYDFVHCTCYYTYWNNELVLPARALEAIINKELYYVGSKYPLCSMVRTRKFMGRGWSINAGQFVKMALQLNELDLKNLHVFEEQLIGVDSFYFNQVIDAVRKMKDEDPNFVPDSQYLINLINEVFD